MILQRTEYLNKLIVLRDKQLIKVITGIRRCGESTLLETYQEWLKQQLRPLMAIRNHYPKFILTLDDDPEAQYEGIRRVNARDWL